MLIYDQKRGYYSFEFEGDLQKSYKDYNLSGVRRILN